MMLTIYLEKQFKFSYAVVGERASIPEIWYFGAVEVKVMIIIIKCIGDNKIIMFREKDMPS